MDKNIFYFEWLEGKEGVGSGAFFNNYKYIFLNYFHTVIYDI